MTLPNKFQKFLNSQFSFFKYLKTNFFKPFDLEAMVEEQDREHKAKTAILKKQSMDSIAKLKMIADLQFAQHQIHDRTKELDYFYQRREANRKKQLDALNELLSTIELDEDGYVVKKSKTTTTTTTNNNTGNSNKPSIENILLQSLQKQKQDQTLQQTKTSIDDLDSMFENNNNNNENNNTTTTTKEYINVNNFDFDSIFKPPTKFSEEEYLKEKNQRLSNLNNNNNNHNNNQKENK